MNLGGIVSKLANNADILAAGGALYSRAVEANPTDPLGEIMRMLDFTRTDGGPIYELKQLTTFQGIKYKLWDAPHLAQLLIKIGVGAYVAGELGLLNSKWANLGKKIAKSSAIIAAITPGSGPKSGQQSFLNQAQPVSQYQY